MGELRGLEIARRPPPQRDPGARVDDYGEIYDIAPAAEAAAEGSRCMDCGVAFCHSGCPLGNLNQP